MSCNHPDTCTREPGRARPHLRRPAAQRGAVYVAVLAVSMLVVLIGIAALTANRLTADTAELTRDTTQARWLATSAMDLALLHIQNNPTSWRQDLSDLAVLADKPFADGTMSLIATDTADGDLTNNNTDPVLLRAVGTHGDARVPLEVTLQSTGIPLKGSWQTAVD